MALAVTPKVWRLVVWLLVAAAVAVSVLVVVAWVLDVGAVDP